MCNLVTVPGQTYPGLVKWISPSLLEAFPRENVRMVNAFGRPTLPIVLADGKVVSASWTFAAPAPPERKAENSWRQLTYNVIGEEMFEKRTFKEAARERRAVLPVPGYFEYQHRGKVKVPYRLYRPGGGLLFLAALWQFYPAEGVYRFAVATMPPTRLTAWVHNSRPRQPMEIPEEHLRTWLDGTTPESVEPFLIPREDDGIVAEETEGITGTRPENPPPAPEFPQGELF